MQTSYLVQSQVTKEKKKGEEKTSLTTLGKEEKDSQKGKTKQNQDPLSTK